MRVFKWGLTHDRGRNWGIAINWGGLLFYFAWVTFGKPMAVIIYKHPLRVVFGLPWTKN